MPPPCKEGAFNYMLRECIFCNKYFTIIPTRPKQKFCSYYCRAKSQSKTGDKHHNWKGGLPYCFCGKQLSTRQSKFCSKHKGTEHRGEKVWNYKGGISKTREYINFYKRKYKYSKRNASGYHTFKDWENLKAQYNWTCPCCGKFEPNIKLTADHIIPLSRGGSDNMENIQPLCMKCNSKKWTNIIKYNILGVKK